MSKEAKWIYVTFSDRAAYRFPASLVAESRATYFATIDSARGFGEYDQVYQAEYEYTLSDEGELMDWLGNSMDWEDVEDVAELVDIATSTPNYSSEFSNAYKEVTWE